jgi:predicted RND superfamily exporter protein
MLLAAPAASVPVNFGFSSFINESLPLVGRYMSMNRRLGFSNRVLLLLEGPDSDLEPVARAIASALEKRPDLVRRVQFEAPKDWLEANAPWLVSNEIFEDWLLVATRAGDPQAAQRLEGHFERLDGETSRLVRPGFRLMTVELDKDPLDEDLTAVSRGASSYSQVQDIAESAVVDRPVKVSFGGVPAVSVQDQETTFNAITRLTPLSLLFVLALLLFVERRLVRLLLVALPMLLSMAAALGAVALLLGEITFGEAFFGMFIFGLGVDYALHLLVRLREERARGLSLEEAVHDTVVGAGRGVVAGAITTVGAFLVIAMFPDPTARHLGISSGVGLLSCMLLMLTVLPAAWLLLGRGKSEREASVLKVPGLARLCLFSVQHPRAVVVGALLLAALSLSGSYRFHAETDLSKIFNRDVPAMAVGERIQELFDVNISPWIVASPTIEEAREVHRAFEADPVFMRAEGIASLFPADLEERALRLRAAVSQLTSTRRQLEVMRIMMPAVAPPRVMKSLAVLERAAESGPPSLDDLPEGIASMVRLPDGEFLTFAYGRFTGLDADTFREQRIRAEAIHPGATGWGAFVEVAIHPPWTWELLAAVLALVMLVLAVDQRSPRWMLLALLPVTFGAAVTFGLLCWLNVGFTVMLTLVVPLLVGLGVDDGIHVVHRMREDESLPADVATCSVGRAIVMTTLTTCASFAVMLFSNHPGMESMALVLIFGLPLCLLASVTLIPAAAVLLGLRSGSP